MTDHERIERDWIAHEARVQRELYERAARAQQLGARVPSSLLTQFLCNQALSGQSPGRLELFQWLIGGLPVALAPESHNAFTDLGIVAQAMQAMAAAHTPAPEPKPVQAASWDEWLAKTAALLEECERRHQ